MVLELETLLQRASLSSKNYPCFSERQREELVSKLAAQKAAVNGLIPLLIKMSVDDDNLAAYLNNRLFEIGIEDMLTELDIHFVTPN